MSERAAFPCVVHVLLLDASGQVCLFRRAGTGFMDGWWGPPGGHLEAGEGVAQAAARECAEETGVRPHGLEPLAVLPYRSGRHQGVNFVFSARAWSGEPVPQPEMFDAMCWAELRELPERTVPWLADVVELMGAGGWFRELRY